MTGQWSFDAFWEHGRLQKAWRNLLLWLGLLGLPSSALHDFSVHQQINGQFATFKARLIEKGPSAGTDRANLRRIKLLYSNVRVVDNDATIDLVLNVPQSLVGQLGLEGMQDHIIKRAKDVHGIDELEINISVIPTQILRYDPGSSPKA